MYDDSGIEGDLLARAPARCAAPRQPSDAVLTSPVHIAVTSWLSRTAGREHSGRLHWVVVVSDRACDGGDPVVHRHYHERSEGVAWAKVIASVRACMEQGSGPAWVAVSTRQIATADALWHAGLPVTLGFADNRASDRAIEVMQTSRRREVSVHGPADDAGADGANTAEHICRWLPTVDHLIEVASAACLIVATDASADMSGIAVSAVVEADGGLAMESVITDCSISEVELNAISLAMEKCGPRVTVELDVLSDSTDAVAVARALAHGRVPAEGYRGIGDSALDRFEDAYDNLSCAVRFFHVKAHVGHPLNEAADDLASIGRLGSRYPRNVVEREFEQRVTALAAAVRVLTHDQVVVPEYEHSRRGREPLLQSLGEHLVANRPTRGSRLLLQNKPR